MRERILEFTPDMHRKKVTCKIIDTQIPEAMIFMEGESFYLLQDIEDGGEPIGLWMEEGYGKSWFVCIGDKDSLESNSVSNVFLLESLLENQTIDLKDYHYFYSSRLGGKLWKDIPTTITINKLEEDGIGYHILTDHGVGLYIIKK